MNSKISVIIACYNQGKFIEECVKSVLNSNYNNIEIIIVNDGSIDPFTNIILENAAWPKTIVYQIQNSGVSFARNYGIMKSNGDYILPLDADDKISPDYISKAVKLLDQDFEIKVVTCEVNMFGVKRGKYQLPDFSLEMLMGQNTMVVSSLFRRKDYDKTAGYNPNMSLGFEDWDFWLSLLESGGKVVKLDFCGFYYRIKRKSRNSSIKDVQFARLRKQIYENHKDLYSKHFFDPTLSFEYSLLENSMEYKIGRAILNPVRNFLNLIS